MLWRMICDISTSYGLWVAKTWHQSTIHGGEVFFVSNRGDGFSCGKKSVPPMHARAQPYIYQSHSLYFLEESRIFGVPYVLSNKVVQVYGLQILGIHVIISPWRAKFQRKKNFLNLGLDPLGYVSTCVTKHLMWFWGFWGVRPFFPLQAFWVTFIISGMEVLNRK